jgi:hypothetical protein
MTDNTQIPVEMYNMIQQFNKQREAGLICDAKCQNDNRIRKLQYKVTQNEKGLSDASGILLKSQRELSQYDPKGYGPTFNRNINTMVDKQIEKLRSGFDKSKYNILQNLDFYNTQMQLKKSMSDIENNKINNLNTLNSDNQKKIGDIRVNQRMSRFYQKKTDYVKSLVKQLRSMFWMTLIILICVFFYYRNNDKITNKKRNIGVLLIFIFIGFMHFLMPIFRFIWKLISLFPKP